MSCPSIDQSENQALDLSQALDEPVEDVSWKVLWMICIMMMKEMMKIMMLVMKMLLLIVILMLFNHDDDDDDEGWLWCTLCQWLTAYSLIIACTTIVQLVSMATYLKSLGLAEIITVIYGGSCFKVHYQTPWRELHHLSSSRFYWASESSRQCHQHHHYNQFHQHHHHHVTIMYHHSVMVHLYLEASFILQRCSIPIKEL